MGRRKAGIEPCSPNLRSKQGENPAVRERKDNWGSVKVNTGVTEAEREGESGEVVSPTVLCRGHGRKISQRF